MKKTAEEIYDDLRKRHKGVWSPKDTAVMAANIYAEQFKPKWIATGDKLPERAHENVLVCRENGTVTIGHFRVSDQYGNEVRNFNILNVTHWMPLPSAPERKEEGR